MAVAAPPLPAAPPSSLETAAARLALLLTRGGSDLAEASGRGDLEFEAVVGLRPLPPRPAPADAWAVDGGQALVADGRCVQLVVTRAARVRFRSGRCVLEDEGELRAAVLGPAEAAVARSALQLPGLASDCAVDVNLLRDRWEWDAVERCLFEAEPGAIVLVDGDLQPDWRIPSTFLASLLERAGERGVVLVGVTKHSSLSRGGAPLLGQLEVEAAELFGDRARWWAPLARTRPDVGYGLQVVAARLDPDARFAFRVDLPGDVDPEPVLGALAALCDDAGFPGYPYPLAVADRLAACPRWLRQEVRMQLEEHFHRAGVPPQVRERAFADRHDLMERS
ncbi:MAG: DNA double-strand break repair nuclease NurA [Actinobacteria bacterium]|nr:DNA double-strand break repair nuclease NurA [Actinomycetota bacterium]MBW3650936.1 DNA double-strand break repair nuclease NurA [Actinomycetota bacterium]